MDPTARHLHTPIPDPLDDEEEPDVRQPPVPPDQEPDVVPMREPPKPGENAPMSVAQGMELAMPLSGARTARIAAAAGASSALGGCELIGDVFQAGVWVGVIIVVALIALVLWIVGKARK